MSNFDTTRAHGLWHHTEAVSSPQIRQDLSDACYQPFRPESSLQVCSPTANIYPTRISQLPRPWDCNNVLAEILRGGREVSDQYPSQAFYGSPAPSTMGASGTQVQNDPQMCDSFGVARVNLDPQMGGLSGCQTPITSHPHVCSSDAVNCAAAVFPHRTWELHTPLFGQMTPTIHGGDVSYQLSAYRPAPQTPQSITNVYSHTAPSMGVDACLPNWQTAAPPPGPTTHMPDSQTSSSTSALSPQASPPAFGHASPTVASSPVLKEEGPKKRLLAIAICPFPHCSRMFRRLQELERHILRHLPRWICCTQPGCSWNGYRLDLLRSHLRKEHRDAPFLEHGSEGIKIYDAKRLVKQLLKKNITVEQAECEAHAASQKGDVELGIRHA